MKRLYSVTLLISLLVGTLQPILPMIEYQLLEGDIIELLGFGEENTETGCDMSTWGMGESKAQQTETNQSLLDVDYYPLALEMTAIPDPFVSQKKSRVYLPTAKDIISPAFLPNPPPPRMG
ncbi:MAG: hypothetical protein JXR26_09955 [Balneolaceae bacterium]|nr:hypothetical protein [Balneolaceae bacterium]